MSEPKPTPDSEHDQEPGNPLVISAEQLFRERREICIEHNGVRYRLRITRRNKLILQK